MTSPRAIVEEFFDRMADDERRATVGELFAEDAVITVPGERFTGRSAPDEMLSFFAPRYDWVDKEFDRWIETDDAVVSQGTLYGMNTDGDRFEEVRYVDIYRVRNERISRLDIYNDLAVADVL